MNRNRPHVHQQSSVKCWVRVYLDHSNYEVIQLPQDVQPVPLWPLFVTSKPENSDPTDNVKFLVFGVKVSLPKWLKQQRKTILWAIQSSVQPMTSPTVFSVRKLVTFVNDAPHSKDRLLADINNRTARIRHQCRKTIVLSCHMSN